MALKDIMGKGMRSEEAPAPAPGPAPVAPPATPAPRPSGPAALLDASLEFEGTMRCRDSIRIDGRCKGRLFCERTVIVGEPAVLALSIEADTVVVAGEVNGDITARHKITLEPTARVTGNLCTPGIVIREGATLEGRIVINTDEAPAKAGADAGAEPAKASA